jgi:hypothetical protein
MLKVIGVLMLAMPLAACATLDKIRTVGDKVIAIAPAIYEVSWGVVEDVEAGIVNPVKGVIGINDDEDEALPDAPE